MRVSRTVAVDTTIRYYDRHAESFWHGTKDHDVSQNVEALLAHLPDQRGLRILDLGCGPGRDLITFRDLGHDPTGLDASRELARLAERQSGCRVLVQRFDALDLPAAGFDGIFANASLFHVQADELPRVLDELHAALAPDGVLFSSNPRGDGEHFDGERYGNYMEFEDYAELLANAGFSVLSHYYRPDGRPCHQQPWLAVISQRQQ